MMASGSVSSILRLSGAMTIRSSTTVVLDADIRNALENALRAALNRWRFVSSHTLQYWLRGYCLCFAKTLLKFMGEPASLGSVLANDGAVHHVIVTLGDLAVDARGVNTKASLLSEINLRAETHKDPLRAVDIIRFESAHALLLKRCPESEARKLRTCLDTPAMRDVRHRTRIVPPS